MNKSILYIVTAVSIIGLPSAVGLVSNRRIQEMNQQIEELKAENIRLAAGDRTSTEKIALLTTEIRERDETIEDLEAAVQEAYKAELDRLRHAREEALQYKRLVVEREEKIRALEAGVGEFRYKVQGLEKERNEAIAALDKRQKEMLNELDRARVDKARLHEVISGHQKQAEGYEKTLEELNRAGRSAEKRVQELLEEIRSATGHSDRLASERDRLAEALREAQARAEQMAEAKRRAEHSLQVQGALIGSLKEEIAADQIQIEQLAGRTAVRLEDTILFDSGKASIRPSGLRVLKKLGETLRKIQDKRIHVEGHADSRSIKWNLKGKYPTNWELSVLRATAVVRYLIDEAGLDETRLSAVGHSFYRPTASNDTPAGQRANRRVVITLLPLTDTVRDEQEGR